MYGGTHSGRNMDSSVPRLGPSARSGRELERKGGALQERVDEGRNVILVPFPLEKLFGVAGGRKEIPTAPSLRLGLGRRYRSSNACACRSSLYDRPADLCFNPMF